MRLEGRHQILQIGKEGFRTRARCDTVCDIDIFLIGVRR